MGETTQEVFCINGHRLDESPGLPVEDRKPCPECGSTARHVKVGLSASVTVRSSLDMRAKPAGGGRAFVTQKVGASWSYARRKWMQIEQLVDRRGNRYRKKVVDPDTGEVLRDVDEPLTDHQGYGSAKAKRDDRRPST